MKKIILMVLGIVVFWGMVGSVIYIGGYDIAVYKDAVESIEYKDNTPYRKQVVCIYRCILHDTNIVLDKNDIGINSSTIYRYYIVNIRNYRVIGIHKLLKILFIILLILFAILFTKNKFICK